MSAAFTLVIELELRRSRDVERAARLADWLDGRYLDPIIGLLLPGVGDWLTALVGTYPIWVAIQHHFPASVIARMLKNLALDALLGTVPVLGDAFDFVWKAHRKNADLLVARHVFGPSPTRDWLSVAAAATVLLAALVTPLLLAALLLHKIW